jgi:hypothetical protein
MPTGPPQSPAWKNTSALCADASVTWRRPKAAGKFLPRASRFKRYCGHPDSDEAGWRKNVFKRTQIGPAEKNGRAGSGALVATRRVAKQGGKYAFCLKGSKPAEKNGKPCCHFGRPESGKTSRQS